MTTRSEATQAASPLDRKVIHRRAHLDLFSGIGGFALAARWAGFETVGFCETDAQCHKVLRKHWPTTKIHGDIKELDGNEYRGVELLTGGFPCQPFSQANRARKGKADDRYLWPEMLRVITEARPSFVVAENSTDIEKFALDTVLSDLDSEGYDAIPIEIPAAGVGANHLRYRTWILANARGINAREWGQRPAPREEVAGCDWWDSYPGIHRVDDGVSRRVDGRKRMLGNAIVPSVAYEILRHLPAVYNV